MILQNKKTGRRVTMPRKEYDMLRQVGFSKNWLVLSNEDDSEPVEKKMIPKDIIDFSTIKPKRKSKAKPKTE